MSSKRMQRVAAVFALLFLFGPMSAQAFPVFDAANLIQMIVQWYHLIDDYYIQYDMLLTRYESLVNEAENLARLGVIPWRDVENYIGAAMADLAWRLSQMDPLWSGVGYEFEDIRLRLTDVYAGWITAGARSGSVYFPDVEDYSEDLQQMLQRRRAYLLAMSEGIYLHEKFRSDGAQSLKRMKAQIEATGGGAAQMADYQMALEAFQADDNHLARQLEMQFQNGWVLGELEEVSRNARNAATVEAWLVMYAREGEPLPVYEPAHATWATNGGWP